MNRPLISVVLTTFSTRRLAGLIQLLESLNAQTYSDIEVVLVVSGAQDAYQAITDRIGSMNLWVAPLITDPGCGAAAGRNVGIQSARGEIVAFLDDDVVVSRDWAAELVRIFREDPTVVGIAGSVEPNWAESSMTWFPKEFYWVIGCTGFLNWKEIRETGHAATANAAYLRDALKIAGGFNTSLGLFRARWGDRRMKWREVGGEDGELSMRVRRVTRKRVVFAPSVQVLHHVPPQHLAMTSIAQRAWAVGRERRMLGTLFSPEERRVMYSEASLARQLFFDFLPRTARRFTRDPKGAWKGIYVATVSVLFGTLGFLTYTSSPTE